MNLIAFYRKTIRSPVRSMHRAQGFIKLTRANMTLRVSDLCVRKDSYQSGMMSSVIGVYEQLAKRSVVGIEVNFYFGALNVCYMYTVKFRITSKTSA